MRTVKNNILKLIIFLFPLSSCETADGGLYKGEMAGGKPHGKGNTLYSNGETYEGEYVKGKRQGYGVRTFTDGKRYEGQWFQD